MTLQLLYVVVYTLEGLRSILRRHLSDQMVVGSLLVALMVNPCVPLGLLQTSHQSHGIFVHPVLYFVGPRGHLEVSLEIGLALH